MSEEQVESSVQIPRLVLHQASPHQVYDQSPLYFNTTIAIHGDYYWSNYEPTNYSLSFSA